ncbi:MAG: response regulator [Desulfuromonadales bacterium]
MRTHDQTRHDDEPGAVATSHKVPSAILVVEDEPEILAPLVHFLKRAGFIVIEAEDGLSACRMIGSQQPDLILLDVMLPDLDGWEVCRMLRQHPDRRIATTPVIMLTALNTPEDKLHGLELGADAYLPKPYSQQEVLLMSRKLIERHRREAELEHKLERLGATVVRQQELHDLMFHELRNQLTILHGFAQVLEHSRAAHDASCITAIHRSSVYLQNLAEDFLLIRKVQEGQLQLSAEPLLVHEVAAEMTNLYASAANSRGISLEVRIAGQPRPVPTNRPGLKIILSSLLDNAIKYGPPDSAVTLTCHYRESHLDLEVCDEGEGIATAERERVFEEFHRGDLARLEHPGKGLGLYGVRVLTRAMGGDAEIDDSVRRGCLVRARLPLYPPQPRTAA